MAPSFRCCRAPRRIFLDVGQKRFQVVLVAEFRNGQMATERIYWDQGAVLRQVGLLA